MGGPTEERSPVSPLDGPGPPDLLVEVAHSAALGRTGRLTNPRYAGQGGQLHMAGIWLASLAQHYRKCADGLGSRCPDEALKETKPERKGSAPPHPGSEHEKLCPATIVEEAGGSSKAVGGRRR
jgi:hypothetical protein